MIYDVKKDCSEIYCHESVQMNLDKITEAPLLCMNSTILIEEEKKG